MFELLEMPHSKFSTLDLLIFQFRAMPTRGHLALSMLWQGYLPVHYLEVEEKSYYLPIPAK